MPSASHMINHSTSTSHVAPCDCYCCFHSPSLLATANNGLPTNLQSTPCRHHLENHNTQRHFCATAVAMDRRQFMPRYTPDRVPQLNSGRIEPAKAPRAPPRTAPPILPPRNPKRLGLPPRSPEKVAQIWDPTLGAYIPRQPTGGFAAPISKKEKAHSRIPTTNGQPLQRSFTTNTFPQHTPPLPISTADRRETIGRSLHEEIKNLRQSYLDDLQSDDVFAPASLSVSVSPPQRSASAASLRSPVRNFSLPTYSSPSKQQGGPPPRPLRRVRSRSVNLGPVAEASELPELPARRESPKGAAVGFGVGDGVSESDHAVTTQLLESTATTPETERESREIHHLEARLESQLAVTFQLPESTTTTPTIESESEQIKRTATALELTLSEGTCNCCGSTRKALAMNPKCCIDHVKERGRVCFRCWSDRLAESLSKQDRKDWLCCLVCGEELVVGDAKRLASRGTMLR
jgi:hypothetical protein